MVTRRGVGPAASDGEVCVFCSDATSALPVLLSPAELLLLGSVEQAVRVRPVAASAVMRRIGVRDGREVKVMRLSPLVTSMFN